MYASGKGGSRANPEDMGSPERGRVYIEDKAFRTFRMLPRIRGAFFQRLEKPAVRVPRAGSGFNRKLIGKPLAKIRFVQ
jgi:hypothetical protein